MPIAQRARHTCYRATDIVIETNFDCYNEIPKRRLLYSPWLPSATVPGAAMPGAVVLLRDELWISDPANHTATV